MKNNEFQTNVFYPYVLAFFVQAGASFQISLQNLSYFSILIWDLLSFYLQSWEFDLLLFPPLLTIHELAFEIEFTLI